MTDPAVNPWTYSTDHPTLLIVGGVGWVREDDLRERIAAEIVQVCDWADEQADGPSSFTTAWLRNFAARIARGQA